MQHQAFNKILNIFSVIMLTGSLFFAGTRTGNAACPIGDPASYGNRPTDQLLEIPCLVGEILNIGVLSVGGVLVIVIFIAALKFATSQGDIKALQGAQQTLTYAVLGFAGVVCLYVIVAIVEGMFGITDVLQLNTVIQGLLTTIYNIH